MSDTPHAMKRPVRFGVFELDPVAGELRKHGLRISLQEQPLQVLQILLEKPGQLVAREELQRCLWPSNTFVEFDKGIYNAIKRLRETLSDDAETPRYIETIPRRGYRFIAPLTSPEGSTEGAPSGKRTRGTRLWFGWGAAVATLAGLVSAGLFVWNVFRVHDRLSGNAAPQIQSLAVLPLTNLSGDPAQEYFSDGMTDALITNLAQIGSLKVISRTSSMQYKQTKKTLPEIARALNVDGIIEGTVQRSGDRIRITAQLIHGPSDKHLWATSYERGLSDALTLEREIAGDIARQVQARLTTGKQALLAQPQPVKPAALEAYLRGNSHMHRFSRGFGDKELGLASEYFQQAIDAEPDFAPAYVGMSKARSGTLRSSTEDIEAARKATERAVQLDPNLSDAWTALADIRRNSWDWAEAERDYRQALALDPNDGIAHERLGWLLDAFGRMDEGWKEAEIAQQLDPSQEHLEPALAHRHEYDQIIKHVTTMLEADPDNGYLHHKLYEGYAGKGMYKEAVQQLEQTLALFGFPESAAKLRQAFAASGYKGAIRVYAGELERFHLTNQLFVPVNLAEAYTAVGDKDRAFYWLEQGYKHRGHGNCCVSLIFVSKDPELEPLRSDPRYRDLLRRIGLPE